MMRGYGFDYGPMMGGIGWWWQVLIVLFWLLVIAGVVLLVIWVVRQTSGAGHGAAHQPPLQPTKDEACEIARIRYAKGEITKEQYEELCRTLGVT